jgi:CHASE2 domain-containing sensor protein
MTTALLLAWESLCVALFWSIFCRTVKVNKTTKLDVRLALWGVGIAALAGMGAPLYGWLPDVVTLLIVLAIVIMQVVMAQHWRHGVPIHFVQDAYRPQRRAADAPLPPISFPENKIL